MKNIFFSVLVLACIFSFGKCNKHKKSCKKKASTEIISSINPTAKSKLNANEILMCYDETKCENPWNFNWFQKPTDAQILGAINGDLSGREINILEINFSTKKDLISCEACNCPTGKKYYVRVNKSEIEKLKALKFYEVNDLPEFENTDNTK